ncbi:hypothetical protein Tco_0542994 [Tanacetum coccineum]|uniref:Uncharacterized protein n=1 Tax=Tanacetum coccineum TaxID=301880 RepID=A0ABQ4XMV2_9ASTR
MVVCSGLDIRAGHTTRLVFILLEVEAICGCSLVVVHLGLKALLLGHTSEVGGEVSALMTSNIWREIMRRSCVFKDGDGWGEVVRGSNRDVVGEMTISFEMMLSWDLQLQEWMVYWDCRLSMWCEGGDNVEDYVKEESWSLLMCMCSNVGNGGMWGLGNDGRVSMYILGVKRTYTYLAVIDKRSWNTFLVDQHAAEDERVLLASLIVNLKLDVDENKTIQKQLKRANMYLNHELEKSKQDLEKSIQDLEISKQDLSYCTSELEKYEIFQTNHKDKEKAELECAKALGLLEETK